MTTITKNITETSTHTIEVGTEYVFTGVTILSNITHTPVFVSDVPFSDTNQGFPIEKYGYYAGTAAGTVYVRLSSPTYPQGKVTVTNTTTGVS